MTGILPTMSVLLVLPFGPAAKEPAETVVRMTVTPMAAPRPALKYQLLPELREMNPGNPIQGYMKCFMEQRTFFYSKEELAKREKWSEMPLKDLPVKELRGYGGLALLQADYAARLDTPDWQVLLKLKQDGVNLLLPEVQQMRELAWALQVRFRGEIADRRFDDALRTAQTMFALSRHLGEHPTLIGDLVGIAVGEITAGQVEELIQQPRCPNLYWALTGMPGPFIDLHRGLQGERVMLAAELAVLDEHAPMTEAQLRKAMERFYVLLNTVGHFDVRLPVKEMAKEFNARVQDPAHVRAARGRLVKAGLNADAVKQFPAMQVVFLDEKLSYEVARDNRMKALALPYWQIPAGLGGGPASKERKGPSLSAWLVPRLDKVRAAQARIDRHIALLRCVEALRLYAAGHDGKLPAKLADAGVPVPVDPFTGKAFLYRLDGDTAVVRGTPPPGLERISTFNVRYEVTIRK